MLIVFGQDEYDAKFSCDVTVSTHDIPHERAFWPGESRMNQRLNSRPLRAKVSNAQPIQAAFPARDGACASTLIDAGKEQWILAGVGNVHDTQCH